MSQHLNCKQMAGELGVSVDQVKKIITSGRLPALNVGEGKRTFWRVSRADFDAYLEARRAETARRFGGAA